MDGIATIIKDYGIQSGLIVILLSFLGWLVKKFVKSQENIQAQFVKSLDEATTERKEITAKYQNFLGNHINENIQAQMSLTQSIKDFATETHHAHNLMIEKLNRIDE